MDLDQLKTLLRNYGLKPNFTYGQNFLVDDLVLQDIVDAAEVKYGDVILEIGPGVGNLTRLLCERALHRSLSDSSATGQAGFVLSVEKDPKFFPILRGVKKNFRDNFRFEIADALEYDFQSALNERRTTAAAEKNADRKAQRPISLPISDQSAAYKVVANIPYYITGKILQMLLTAKHKPTSITVLTQKEVARNLAAAAGDLGILAISVQLFGQPKLVQTVLAGSFYPVPKVDSAIVKIDLFEKPKYKIDDEKKFFKIVKACFSGKRKQIHNTLVNNLGLEKPKALEILASLKINPAARPQELTIEQWVKLNDKIFI